MGQRGPLPSSRNTLKLHGSWRANCKNSEPDAEPCIPPRPKFLKGEARKEWDRITPILIEMRCISEADMAMIAAYCLEWSRYAALARKLSKLQDVVRVTANGNEILNPFHIAQNMALKNCQKLAAEFGLSPAARIRIKMELKKDDINPFAKLLREKNGNYSDTSS